MTHADDGSFFYSAPIERLGHLRRAIIPAFIIKRPGSLVFGPSFHADFPDVFSFAMDSERPDGPGKSGGAVLKGC